MISLNYKNMLQPKLQNGLDEDSLEKISNRLAAIKENFIKDKANLSFTKLPYEFETLKIELEKSSKMIEGMQNIVVIGIGGSDLGARAIFKALKHSYYNELAKENEMKFFFAGDTTDPESISDLLDLLDLSKTLFIVVSKSGNTIEPASVFIYFRDLVISKLGKDLDKKHFVFITDPQSGSLQKLAKEQGYQTIIHEAVGGRFSVLSSVGMVPAHLMGLDVSKFLDGAKDLDLQLQSSNADNDIALRYAALQYLYAERDHNISVIMPYQYSLYSIAKWYSQLLAESIGKKADNEGNVIHAGITPAAALGPTDQHSQLQLFNEGPNDKIFTFITAKNSRRDINIPQDFSGVEEFEYMKGRTFHEILNYEKETSAFALTKNDRPNCTIEIDQIDEYHIGQIFYFFEVVVAYLGYFYNLNTYDQPGVELSKNAMYGVIGKEGYDNEKKEFESYIN